jgi:hypothetical protein
MEARASCETTSAVASFASFLQAVNDRTDTIAIAKGLKTRFICF